MNEWNISKAQFGKSDWNPFSAASKGIEKLGAAATAAVTASALGQQIQAHKEHIAASEQANRESTERMHMASVNADLQKHASSQEFELKKMYVQHVLGEKSAKSAHKRLGEFHGQLARHSQPGTEVKYKAGDVSASFTKATPKARPVKTETPAAAPAARGPVDVGMPSMPAAKPKTSAAVGRDPKTGRAVSLKSSSATTIKKTATPKATAGTPSVTRDSKTGRIRSLKKA